VLSKLKAKLEEKDAANRHPLAIRLAAPGMRTTGGTDWSQGGGINLGSGSKFRHMNTEQFMEHLGHAEEPPS
jgi:hypothetical protein